MNSEQLMQRYAQLLLEHPDQDAIDRACVRLKDEARRNFLECWQPLEGSRPQ
jgi:hypothetical protein